MGGFLTWPLIPLHYQECVSRVCALINMKHLMVMSFQSISEHTYPKDTKKGR